MDRTDEVRVHRFPVTVVEERPIDYVHDPVPVYQRQEFKLKVMITTGGYFGHSTSHVFR